MSLEISEMAKMSSKGQITVPATIRNILNLKAGSTVLFKITENGILFVPCEIKEKNSYSQEEWGKIERLVADRGAVYKTARAAKRHLKSL
jgi:AbrB family looped-hinge helix DNA binding protein